jgi:hypothetical protein
MPRRQVHVFSAAHNLELVEKPRGNTRTGARLLLVDLWTDPTYSGPPAAALISEARGWPGARGKRIERISTQEWLGETVLRKLERNALRLHQLDRGGSYPGVRGNRPASSNSSSASKLASLDPPSLCSRAPTRWPSDDTFFAAVRESESGPSRRLRRPQGHV